MIAMREENHVLDQWRFSASSGPILHSKCKTPDRCVEIRQAESAVDGSKLCILCRYIHTLRLPSHPDMTFAWNRLRIEHAEGFGVEFNALDALKLVVEKNYIPKVAIANAWREARQALDSPEVKTPDSHKFDWTFTTSYKGSLFGKDGALLKEVETAERIDLSKLTSEEPIHFYQDLCLFEDELSDHGVAKLNVKIRVMRNNFFLLLRFFLRVDKVLIRMNDIRLYWESGKSYLLREYCEREHKEANKLNLPIAVLTDPVALSQHLPVVLEQFHSAVLNCAPHHCHSPGSNGTVSSASTVACSTPSPSRSSLALVVTPPPANLVGAPQALGIPAGNNALQLRPSEACIPCEICGRRFRSVADVRSHVAAIHLKNSEDPERRFQCEFCPFRAYTKTSIRQHMFLHTGEVPYKCDLCSYGARQKFHLDRHRQKAHGMAPTPKRGRFPGRPSSELSILPVGQPSASPPGNGSGGHNGHSSDPEMPVFQPVFPTMLDPIRLDPTALNLASNLFKLISSSNGGNSSAGGNGSSASTGSDHSSQNNDL